jgi:hypothetical protein
MPERQPKPMSVVPPSPALGDDAHAALCLPGLQGPDLERGGDAGADRGGVAEERVDPRQLPRRLGVGRREHLEAAGRVRGDELVSGGPHRRVDGIARAQRLAAALACAMAGVERIVSLDRGLDSTLLRREQAVADREGTGLIELDGLVHVTPLSLRSDRRRAAGSRR